MDTPRESNDAMAIRLPDVYEEENKEPIVGRVINSQIGVTISFESHGDCNSGGESPVILIEQRNGEVHVVIWDDINKEDPTHDICLDGARESRRKE